MSILLGCIADDFTGATDLANTLVKEGMRAVQLIGVPGADQPAPDAEAVVIALKSRTIAPADAVAQSRAALAWLRAAGARQVFFKYCSTFDSTDAGNIGPVADALLADLDADFTLACPAFPANGRSVFMGHLFVGDRLLNDSGMQDHPLTPMTDPDLVRVLSRQTDGGVGLAEYATIEAGPAAIAERFKALRADGVRYAITDAVTERHLRDIGTAARDMALITGGSGIAMGLPANFRAAGLMAEAAGDRLDPAGGAAAVLSGSASRATQGQVAAMRQTHEAFFLDPLAAPDADALAAGALDWADSRLGERPLLIYATAAPDQVRAVQDKLGVAEAGALIEDAQGQIAQGLVARGVRRLVVAGGETSGAVVSALGIDALRIGPEIDPGVPWTQTLGDPPLFLALKSGNFGGEDFLTRAFEVLP